MKHQNLGLSHSTKRSWRREFLGERVVPWVELAALAAQLMLEGRLSAAIPVLATDLCAEQAYPYRPMSTRG